MLRLSATAGIYGPGRSALDAAKQKVSCPLKEHLLLGCYGSVSLFVNTLVHSLFSSSHSSSHCLMVVPTVIHSTSFLSHLHVEKHSC